MFMTQLVNNLPYDIGGLRLYLDADDDSTITEASGSVSQWDDKSSSGNNAAQATGSRQPQTNTGTIGGKNALEFGPAGTIDWLDTTTNIAEADMTCMVAMESILPGGPAVVGNIISGVSPNLDQTLKFDPDVDTYGRVIVYDRTNTVQFSLLADVDSTPLILTSKFDSGANTMTIYLNKDSLNSGTYDDTITAQRIGGSSTGVGGTTGFIAEVLIYERTLADFERIVLYDYQAFKWSI